MNRITKEATISDCGQYRYLLRRTWNVDADPLLFIMLNPSKADAEVDDPTIVRCIGFGEREGAGGIWVVNLFAMRSTDPDELKKVADPVGPMNDQFIKLAVSQSLKTVLAWGSYPADSRSPRLMDRCAVVRRMVADMGVKPVCLGKTAKHHPRHPLMVKSVQPLVPVNISD